MITQIHSRWLTAALCTLLSGCGPFFGDMAERRAAYAEAAKGPIVVAVIDDQSIEGYLDGVRLGAEQINASDNGLLGRPIELLVRDGHDDFHKMLPTIRSIAANPMVTAILGHHSSDVAVPASITYEKARLLFMPPFATSQQLTSHGFDFLLRMLPDDKHMTAQIASLASLFGYQRIAVLHDRSESGRALAFLFEDAARRFAIDIAFRGSFFASRENYRELIIQLKGLDFDAIFLSTETQAGARMLRQLRGQGIDKPVLGSDALGAGPLVELAGDAGDRTIVPTVFNPEATHNRKQQRFIRDYLDSYGKLPDQGAAQGYDSIKLLATLIERGDTTEAHTLATTAHYTAPIAGITGIHAYDPQGNIHGKSYRFKVLQFGRWWPLPGVTLPHLLAGFQDVLAPDSNTALQAATPMPHKGVQPYSPAMTSATDPVHSKQRNLRAGEQPVGIEETHPLGDGESLAALTRGYRGIAERDQAWFALAHKLLGFKRLGLVLPAESAHHAALPELMRSVASQRGFEVETCELPVQEPKDDSPQAVDDTAGGGNLNSAIRNERIALEQTALRCYSRLARSVDSLFVLTDTGLSPSYLLRLNRALLHFGVSTFAFQDTIKHDYGLTLALVGSGLDLRDPNLAMRFNGVLNGIKVHELNKKISHLPLVTVNLDAARSLKLFTDPLELTLISDVLDSLPPQPALSLTEETN